MVYIKLWSQPSRKSSRIPNMQNYPQDIFTKKTFVTDQAILPKLENQDREPLPDLENRYSHMRMVKINLETGNFVDGFQRIKLDGRASKLDHRDCLKRMVEYELETFNRYVVLYKKLIVDEGSLDIKKREQEFDKIMIQRAKVEPLEAYARERLAGEAEGGGGENEEFQYRPLLLFFYKAFNPEPGSSYSNQDIEVLIHLFFMELEVLMKLLMGYPGASRDKNAIKRSFHFSRHNPEMNLVIERIGLEIEFFD